MLKLVAFVALFAGFCWFGTQVPLGAHTLFGHLHAIAGTKESQDLFDGTKESAKPVVDNVRRRIAGAPDPRAKTDGEQEAAGAAAGARHASSDGHADAGAPSLSHQPTSHEEITTTERRRLRRLISTADGASSARR